MTATATPDILGTGRAPDPDHARLVIQLAGDITHEISNHLQVMLGNAELLGSTAVLPERACGQLAWIVDAGREAAAGNAVLRALVQDGTGAGVRGSGGYAALGEALDAQIELLERLLGGVALAVETGPGVREALPRSELSSALLPCLVLLRRSELSDGDVLTLHAAVAEPDGTGRRPRLELWTERRSGTSPAAPCAGRASRDSLAALLSSLVERAGGRVGSDGSRDEVVALPLEDADSPG